MVTLAVWGVCSDVLPGLHAWPSLHSPITDTGTPGTSTQALTPHLHVHSAQDTGRVFGLECKHGRLPPAPWLLLHPYLQILPFAHADPSREGTRRPLPTALKLNLGDAVTTITPAGKALPVTSAAVRINHSSRTTESWLLKDWPPRTIWSSLTSSGPNSGSHCLPRSSGSSSGLWETVNFLLRVLWSSTSLLRAQTLQTWHLSLREWPIYNGRFVHYAIF